MLNIGLRCTEIRQASSLELVDHHVGNLESTEVVIRPVQMVTLLLGLRKLLRLFPTDIHGTE